MKKNADFPQKVGLLSLPVLVAALGYFVDIYDLLLFSIIRMKSLHGLGLSDIRCKIDGEMIISIQMIGLLVGGVIWGIMGDKKGRLSVLFGSIILYSLANIANGFVQNVFQYGATRFIAGIGLAGELGAGITLVSELVSKEDRGKATSIVAGIGLSGAVAAYFISSAFDWRVCYFIGGGLGFCLLLLRVSVFESGMYTAVKNSTAEKGNILMFFTNGARFKKYLLSILIGLPTWYVIGVLLTFAKEFGEKMNIPGKVESGKAVMFAYCAISAGDLMIGFLSHELKSRKKALYVFFAFTAVGIFLFFSKYNNSLNSMYYICVLLGFGTGFWALFVTMAAEHFGTNLRATAATTVPNIVRGSLPLILLLFNALQPSFSYVQAGAITGIIIMIVSSLSIFLSEETFGKDLNFLEK